MATIGVIPLSVTNEPTALVTTSSSQHSRPYLLSHRPQSYHLFFRHSTTFSVPVLVPEAPTPPPRHTPPTPARAPWQWEPPSPKSPHSSWYGREHQIPRRDLKCPSFAKPTCLSLLTLPQLVLKMGGDREGVERNPSGSIPQSRMLPVGGWVTLQSLSKWARRRGT